MSQINGIKQKPTNATDENKTVSVYLKGRHGNSEQGSVIFDFTHVYEPKREISKTTTTPSRLQEWTINVFN